MITKLLLSIIVSFSVISYLNAQGCNPDNTAPVGVCRTSTKVALSNNGLAFVDAKEFDEGSYDNCGDVFFKVARANADDCGKTKFDDKVSFCCGDVGKNVVVRLKIFDNMPVWGEVAENYNAGGNVNECTVNVQVEDYVPPTITCPPSLTVNCDAYYLNSSNLSEGYMDLYLGRVVSKQSDRRSLSVNIANDGKNYGVPVGFDGLASDNCGIQTITVSSTSNQSMCGLGTITRVFTAIDKGGRYATCNQSLTILPGKSITEANIIWPKDTILYQCNGSLNPDSLPLAYRKPIINGNGCGQILYTYKDEFFTITAPGCRKILRTWKVIDWCTYNVNQPTGPGQWTHTQIFKITTNIPPVFDAKYCQNDTICVYSKTCKMDTVKLTAVAKSDCVPSYSLNYYWKIDLNDDGTLDITGSGSIAKLTASNGLTYGTHRIMWAVEDGCGNVETCHKLITLKNCTKPTPIAKLLAVNLMPNNCMLSLDAKYVNNFSWDNCTPMDKLRLRIARSGTFSPKPKLNEVLAMNQYVIFDGFDVGKNVRVALFAIDEEDNFDYVETYVNVQSNMASCDSNITTTSNIVVAIENIAETLSMDNTYLVVKNTKTNEEKTYDPVGNQAIVVPTIVGQEYTITPKTTKTNLIENVNSIDVVKLYRHVQGIDTIKNPYLKIAANVNNDNKISLSDMVELRKIILQSQNYFTNNTNWKFVFRNQILDKLDANNNAYTFKSAKQNNPITFVAIKTGDIYNNLISDFSDGNIERSLTQVDINDEQINENELFAMPIHLENIDQIEGLQLSFNYDFQNISFDHIQSTLEGFSSDNIGINLENGKVIISWIGKAQPAQSTIDFNIYFRTKSNSILSKLISFDTKDQLIINGNDVKNIAFNFVPLSKFELYQNTPNPTNGQTILSFYIPQNDKIQLDFMDNSGKIIDQIKDNFSKGFNQISFDTQKWNTKGIIYYRIKSSFGIITKKMTILD